MNTQPKPANVYALFCMAACGYFSIAAVQAWPNPIAVTFDGGSSYNSGSSGPHYSRSSGGFGGGGK